MKEELQDLVRDIFMLGQEISPDTGSNRSLKKRAIDEKHNVRTRQFILSFRKPPRKLLDNAVKAWQLYFGASSIPVKSAKRMYDRAEKLTKKVADISGLSEYEATKQLEAEAERRGKIIPIPGKEY